MKNERREYEEQKKIFKSGGEPLRGAGKRRRPGERRGGSTRAPGRFLVTGN